MPLTNSRTVEPAQISEWAMVWELRVVKDHSQPGQGTVGPLSMSYESMIHRHANVGFDPSPANHHHHHHHHFY
ncbi:hypothetical protein GX51_02078 [Blastomyces parvus]|uniref:Uncharacterized protein n=1 Tax=Blastomyces parvus TaxID=2060905 RepID=A0A2B7XEF5_9EURO|nr:hypothetical protein GX51_02078 [Blastomyces parvus]